MRRVLQTPSIARFLRYRHFTPSNYVLGPPQGPESLRLLRLWCLPSHLESPFRPVSGPLGLHRVSILVHLKYGYYEVNSGLWSIVVLHPRGKVQRLGIKEDVLFLYLLETQKEVEIVGGDTGISTSRLTNSRIQNCSIRPSLGSRW